MRTRRLTHRTERALALSMILVAAALFAAAPHMAYAQRGGSGGGPAARVRSVSRQAVVIPTPGAGVAGYPVAGAAPGRLDGVADSVGMRPAGRGAGAGGFLPAGSLTPRLRPARLHINSSTTAPTTIPITTPITGFHTPHRRTLRRDAPAARVSRVCPYRPLHRAPSPAGQDRPRQCGPRR